MSQRALVTGATGLLGRQVVKAFERAGYEVVGTGFNRASPPATRKVDIQNVDEVTRLVDEVKPHVVVHCAADRQPDSCTANPDAARRLNVSATSTLARLCSTHDIFLLYISTDYVFPGKPGDAPYAATAPPSPPNIYGETKLAGEQEVLSHTEHQCSVVLRIPVLYGETYPRDNNKESAVNSIMDALWTANGREGPGQQQTVKMDDWGIRYPTNTEDVARVCVDIVKVYSRSRSRATEEARDGAPLLPRILQFSSEDRMTKYEIMRQFAEIMGLSMENVTADGNDDKDKKGQTGAGGVVATSRPYDCHLSTRELKDIGVDVSTMNFVAWWRRYVGAIRR